MEHQTAASRCRVWRLSILGNWIIDADNAASNTSRRLGLERASDPLVGEILRFVAFIVEFRDHTASSSHGTCAEATPTVTLLRLVTLPLHPHRSINPHTDVEVKGE